MTRVPLLKTLALIPAVLLIAADLYPCAPAPPDGSFVYIQEESAVIVWDSANKMQHFVRRASFRSNAPDFGFLVPTPSKPDLAEVSNDAFQILETVMRPRIIEEDDRGIRLTSLIGEFFLLRRRYETAGAPPQSVRVLEFKNVAGYDAAILEADDAESLNGWLKDHGYPSSAALQKWFEPYVAMKWKITAFKVAGDRDSGTPATSTVRMSFAADRPFFPYREPESGNEETPARTLQVLMLSDARMQGSLGDGSPWAGRLRWADRISGTDESKLLQVLGLQKAGLPSGLWLSAFEDPSSPRPGHDDLFFQRSADQSAQVPPPYVIHHDARIPIPLDLLAVIAAVVVFIIRRRR